MTIIGHERTLILLRKILERGTFAHAFLFYGPKGVGKRTVAMEFVRGILCRKRIFSGCGTCGPCGEWTQLGTSRDFLSIAPDEKGTISIESARNIVNFLSRTPSISPAKAVIVDDADQLTEEAGTTLLKTLEEPPGNSILIFVTAKPGRLFQTIRSRLMPIRFSLVPDEAMADVPREIRSLVAGRPGEARQLIENKTLRARTATLLERAERVISGDVADKILFANELAEDPQALTMCMSYWIGAFHRRLHEERDASRLWAIGRNIRLALTTAFMLEDTELAPKLLVENMLLTMSRSS